MHQLQTKQMDHSLAILTLGVACGFCLFRQRTAPFVRQRPREERSGRSAVILGATGATGSKVLEELLSDDDWAEVVSIGRREIYADGVGRPPKLREVVVDYRRLKADARGAFMDADIVFDCLGTTRAAAGGATGFVEVERDFTASAAREAKNAGVRHFSVVAAQGANSAMPAVDWIHPLLYIRTLGEKEDAVRAEGFERASFFRPGMLNREKEDRAWEVAVNALGVGLKVTDLARAMLEDAATPVAVAADEIGEAVYDDGAIRALAKTRAPQAHSRPAV